MSEPFPFIYAVLSIGAILCLLIRRSKIGRPCIIILSVLLAAVAIFRGELVGNDYESYIYVYNHTNDFKATDLTGKTIDVGFAALILLFKSFGFNFVVFFGFCYFVFWAGVLRLVKFLKVDEAYGIFFLFFLGYYFDSFNVIRQIMAIGMLLMFIPLLYKKKYVLFSLFIFLIYTLHKSVLLCLLLIPIYMISQKRDINKCLLAIVLLASYAVYYVGTTYFYQYATVLMQVLGFSDGFGAYVENGELRQEIGNTTSTVFTLFALLILLCKDKTTYRFETNAVILSYALFNVGSLFMVFAIRIYMWYNIFAIVLLPSMIKEKGTRHRALFTILCYVIVLSLFVIRYVTGNYNDIKPYYLVF